MVTHAVDIGTTRSSYRFLGTVEVGGGSKADTLKRARSRTADQCDNTFVEI